jgi:hypothetical protein
MERAVHSPTCCPGNNHCACALFQSGLSDDPVSLLTSCSLKRAHTHQSLCSGQFSLSLPTSASFLNRFSRQPSDSVPSIDEQETEPKNNTMDQRIAFFAGHVDVCEELQQHDGSGSSVLSAYSHLEETVEFNSSLWGSNGSKRRCGYGLQATSPRRPC